MTRAPVHHTPPLRGAVAAALAAGALLATHGTAHASGLELPMPGSTRYTAASATASSVYLNPAGLGALTQPTLGASVGLLAGSVSYARERRARYQVADSFDFALPIDEADIDPERTGAAGEVSDTPIAPVGDLFVAAPLGQLPLALGFGVYAPYGAMLSFPDDGPQRWTVQDVTLLNVAATPALAWRLSDHWSVGVSVPTYLGVAELTRVQDFAELADMGDALAAPPISQPNDFGPDAPTGVRELSVLARPLALTRATGVAPTLAAGLLWRPSEHVSVGASYTHSARMTYAGTMQIDMDDDFFTQDLVDQGLAFDPLVHGRGTLSLTLPWTLRAALEWKLGDRHTVALSGARVGWSSVDRLDVRARSPQLAQAELGLPETVSLALPRHWADTWDARVTHTVAWQADRAFWYGLGVMSPASPDAWMDLAAIDGWRVQVVSGGSVPLSATLSLDVDAELQAMAPRTVVASTLDRGNGTYRLALLRLGGHLTWRW